MTFQKGTRPPSFKRTMREAYGPHDDGVLYDTGKPGCATAGLSVIIVCIVIGYLILNYFAS